MDCWGRMKLVVCWMGNNDLPKSGPDCCNPIPNPTILQIQTLQRIQSIRQILIKIKHKNKYIISQDHPHSSQSRTFKEGILSLWTMIIFWYLPKITIWSVWIWTIIKQFYFRNNWSTISCSRTKQQKAMLQRKIALRILQRERMVRMVRITKIVKMARTISKTRTTKIVKTVRTRKIQRIPQKTPTRPKTRPHPQAPWSRHPCSNPNPSSHHSTNPSPHSSK